MLFLYYKSTKVMPNYNDFKICTLIGTLVEKGEKDFTIISKDNGYTGCIDFIKETYGIEINKTSQLDGNGRKDKAYVKKVSKKGNKIHNNQTDSVSLNNKTNDVNKAIIENLIKNSKSCGDFQFKCIAEFGREKGTTIYKSNKNKISKGRAGR